jgi:lysophospholipase L1-like esterase
VPLAGPGITNTLGFIDEFHYDADGTRALVDDFAKELEPLLK